MGTTDKTNFTVQQVADEWQIDPKTARRLFRHEPGVVTLTGRGTGKRVALRIPRSVVERVIRRLTV
jgi:hypothetical protein